MLLSYKLKLLIITVAIFNLIKCQQQQQYDTLIANLSILIKLNQSEFINLKNFTGFYLSGSPNIPTKGQLVLINQSNYTECSSFSIDNAETKYIGLFNQNKCPLDVLIKFGIENKAQALVIIRNLDSNDIETLKSTCTFLN
jgi:hypothetical protein